MDEIIAEYKKQVDRTLIRHNLQLTVQERFAQLQQMARFRDELAAARKGRSISGQAPVSSYQRLLASLGDADVEFILAGAFAAAMHGANLLETVVEVVYRRNPENQARLVAALAPAGPYPRGEPPGLSFRWNLHTLGQTFNLRLKTDLGAINLFAEIVDGSTYEDLLPDSESTELSCITLRVLSARRLIPLLRSTGRPRELESAAELEAKRLSFPRMLT